MRNLRDAGRHCFARGVKCRRCGKTVQCVRAESWYAARDGEGVCEECLSKRKRRRSKRMRATETKQGGEK